jgi:hypothetical protein
MASQGGLDWPEHCCCALLGRAQLTTMLCDKNFSMMDA